MKKVPICGYKITEIHVFDSDVSVISLPLTSDKTKVRVATH